MGVFHYNIIQLLYQNNHTLIHMDFYAKVLPEYGYLMGLELLEVQCFLECAISHFVEFFLYIFFYQFQVNDDTPS